MQSISAPSRKPALRDDFTFDRIWWHAGNPDLSQVGKRHINGGLHLGTLAQAIMRRRVGDDLHAFRITMPAGRRRWGFMRDLSGDWSRRCDAHRWRGKLAMVYLNRFEGCMFTAYGHRRPSQEWMTSATDTAFRARFPESSWSVIALSPHILTPVGKDESLDLLRAA